MTGICGWMAYSARLADPLQTAQAMAGALPGQERRVVLSTPSMGLSVVDAASALSADGQIAVAVTGDLEFRQPDLARRAEADGAAQALLSGYEQLGADGLLPALKGTYAIAVLDGRRRTALIAVDRMGVRPLCHASDGAGGLVFASSTSAVTAHPAVGRRLDPQALVDYAFLHIVPAPRTIYAGVSKLQPAEVLNCSPSTCTTRLYWQPRFIPDQPADAAALQQELRTTLGAAVERAMRSDTVGSFLSGGLDSSTVTGFAARNGTRLSHAYTIGFQQQGYDESGYARLAAAHFGADLRLYYVTPADVAANIEAVAQAYDEPFGNSSALPALLCARHAQADGVQVMLAGDGGDELFAGNERYAKQKLFEYYQAVPHWLRRSVLEPLAYGLGQRSPRSPFWKLYRYVDQARRPTGQRLVEVFDQYKGMQPEFIFEPELLRQVDATRPARELAQYYDAAPAGTSLDRMLYLDWKLTLADNDLRKVNRMAELAGVRVRYPMLDEDVVALSTRVPADLKLRGLKLRDFYKRAFAGFLPAAIIDKRKHGFGLPFGEWLKTEPVLRDLTYPSLEALKSRGIFRAECIDHLVATHRDGHASYYGSMVWALLMLELWFQQHRVTL